MTLEKLTREELSGIIAEAVRDALGDHPCRYSPTPGEVDHIFGMVADLGDGDRRRGTEVLRRIHTWATKRIEKDDEFVANHKFITGIRTAVDGVTFKIFKAFIWISLAITIFTLTILTGTKLSPILNKLVP